MLNTQSLPPRAMNWSSIREPAHPMAMPPWWSNDPAQMASMRSGIQQMISAVLRRYSDQLEKHLIKLEFLYRGSTILS